MNTRPSPKIEETHSQTTGGHRLPSLRGGHLQLHRAQLDWRRRSETTWRSDCVRRLVAFLLFLWRWVIYHTAKRFGLKETF